jgi:cytochrome c oxidase cbb3-type subunit III
MLSGKPLCIYWALAITIACTGACLAQVVKDHNRRRSSGTNQQAADESLRNIYPNLPPNQAPAAVARGKRLFESNCAFCHGTDATGGNGGPDLLRSVLVNHDEKGELIVPVIREGRVSKGMPKFALTGTQVSDLVAFLHQRNRDARLRFTYKIPNVAVGDAPAGKVYFESHCASCHSGTGDLAAIVARYPADELQQRWLYPPTGSIDVTLTLASGQKYSGKVKHLDEFDVSLYDEQGTYRSFALTPEIHVAVTDPLEPHHKLLEQMTDTDMHNVTTYLETLK